MRCTSPAPCCPTTGKLYTRLWAEKLELELPVTDLMAEGKCGEVAAQSRLCPSGWCLRPADLQQAALGLLPWGRSSLELCISSCSRRALLHQTRPVLGGLDTW